jgi:hypothetical protein
MLKSLAIAPLGTFLKNMVSLIRDKNFRGAIGSTDSHEKPHRF